MPDRVRRSLSFAVSSSRVLRGTTIVIHASALRASAGKPARILPAKKRFARTQHES
jgi:hypothetical protein